MLDTKTPFRVEKLADGSFLLVWHSLDRADIYEQKMNWLRDNLVTSATKTTEVLPTSNPEIKNEIERVSYAEIRRSAPLELRGAIEIFNASFEFDES